MWMSTNNAALAKLNFHPAQAAGADQFDIGACGRLCLMFLGLPQPDDLPEVTAQADATAAHDQRQVAVACCAGRTVLPASSTMVRSRSAPQVAWTTILRARSRGHPAPRLSPAPNAVAWALMTCRKARWSVA